MQLNLNKYKTLIMNSEWKRYLFWFAHEHIDFREAVSGFLFTYLSILHTC